MKFAILFSLLFASYAAAINIKFVNKCSFPVWAAVGKAANGQPDRSVAWGQKINANGGSGSFGVGDKQIGIRAWGRTGCQENGTGCKTGGCVGGLTCTDAGLNSGVIVSEYGFGDFGQFGGQRTAWDLSRVGLSINLDTSLASSDGKKVTCRKNNCPKDQAYDTWDDYAADRNSPLGQTYTHTFCA
ncbi:Osmotin thaumatin-like protein [Cylindrobasidium torrendii FP15055 ss-10]|uniref:Osmotin thaumatin-like protein n=1 Tax=Cylindrobasidium torrendii FP15055 ss-10 TaxID=1314674 RepID=A0A0D7B5E4_9AGAR|nr:Osmotin thaumatin-like protein [Cylindrobasidium torrendii FP15055 ss-10]